MGVCSSKHSHSPGNQHVQQGSAQQAGGASDSLGSHITAAAGGDENGHQLAGQAADASLKTPRSELIAEDYPQTPVPLQPAVPDATPEPKVCPC